MLITLNKFCTDCRWTVMLYTSAQAKSEQRKTFPVCSPQTEQTGGSPVTVSLKYSCRLQKILEQLIRKGSAIGRTTNTLEEHRPLPSCSFPNKL